MAKQVLLDAGPLGMITHPRPNQGYPTAHDHALDADVIFAAQAALLEKNGDPVFMVTTNVGHLQHFGDAREWSKVTVADLT